MNSNDKNNYYGTFQELLSSEAWRKKLGKEGFKIDNEPYEYKVHSVDSPPAPYRDNTDYSRWFRKK